MQQACAGWLEWVKVGADLLKGIAWPLAAFALVWMFRDQIRPRLGHLRKLGTGGVEFDAQPLEPRQTHGGVLQPIPPHPMKTVNALIDAIQSELTRYQDDYRETVLVASLAQARVDAAFEYIFGLIFQSQISALREVAVSPIALQEARKLYETRIVPTNPELYSTLDFDVWTRFLIGQQLVKIEDEVVSITDAGIDFLLFVDTKKVGMIRPN